MAKHKVLIVDDEALARSKIRRFLGEVTEPIEIFEAENGAIAIQRIKDLKPEIVFLDIDMPEISGFDVLAHIETRNFSIIFQTAYDEFAIKAFEVHACDYILKPYNLERFLTAFNRAFQRLTSDAALRALEGERSHNKNFLRQLVISQGAATEIIPISSIECFISRDHYTSTYVGKKEYLSDLSLNHLEERLDPQIFCRIHRNSIVRLESIQSLSSHDGTTLTLANQMSLPVARRRMSALKKLLVVNQKSSQDS